MYFQQNLTKAYNSQIDILATLVAAYVDQNIDGLNANVFEAVCQFVYDWVQTSNIQAHELVVLIGNGLGDGDITKQMFLDPKGIDFITEYLNCRI